MAPPKNRFKRPAEAHRQLQTYASSCIIARGGAVGKPPRMPYFIMADGSVHLCDINTHHEDSVLHFGKSIGPGKIQLREVKHAGFFRLAKSDSPETLVINHSAKSGKYMDQFPPVPHETIEALESDLGEKFSNHVKVKFERFNLKPKG